MAVQSESLSYLKGMRIAAMVALGLPYLLIIPLFLLPGTIDMLSPTIFAIVGFSGVIFVIIYVLYKLWFAFTNAIKLQITNWPMRIGLLLYAATICLVIAALASQGNINAASTFLATLIFAGFLATIGNIALLTGCGLDDPSNYE